ncbi:hypothetical protein [Gemmatimonas sp.]|uniref:hypothetical protein n=1 Tax=Gemmatimonas sp. TaxID=1962908 RepID=UPI003567850C
MAEVEEFPEPFNIRRNNSQQRCNAGGTELAHCGFSNGSNSNRSRTALWIAVEESLLDFRVLVTARHPQWHPSWTDTQTPWS